MNLNHLFDLSLTGRRDTVALEFAGREFTFGEIDDRAATASPTFSPIAGSRPATASASTSPTASR